MNTLRVRPITAGDSAAVAEIYNHYVEHTTVTFEEVPVSADEMSNRIEHVRGLELPWLIAETSGSIAGYAYATEWRPRSAYRFSAEVTVYLRPQSGGHGYGSALYDRLFEELHRRKIHAVLGGIALPNDASIALHEKFGMRKVAHLHEVGFKFDRWIDVGYWQRVLPVEEFPPEV